VGDVGRVVTLERVGGRAREEGGETKKKQKGRKGKEGSVSGKKLRQDYRSSSLHVRACRGGGKGRGGGGAHREKGEAATTACDKVHEQTANPSIR